MPDLPITVPPEIHSAVSEACGSTFAASYLCGAVVRDGLLLPKTLTAWERLTANRHALGALRKAKVQLVKPQPFDPADDRMIGGGQ